MPQPPFSHPARPDCSAKLPSPPTRPTSSKNATDPAVADKWEGKGWIARPQIQNWLDSIKSRELPNADVETGHRSVTICHLLNITRELARKLHWNPATEQFLGDDQANALLERPRRAGFELPTA